MKSKITLLPAAVAALTAVAFIVLLKYFLSKTESLDEKLDPLEEYVRLNFTGKKNLIEEISGKLQSYALLKRVSFATQQELPATKPKETREIIGFLKSGKYMRLSPVETLLFAGGIADMFMKIEPDSRVDFRFVEITGGKNRKTSLLNKRFGFLSDGRIYLPHENIVLQREDVEYTEITDLQAKGYFHGIAALYYLKEEDFTAAIREAESAAVLYPQNTALAFLKGHIKFLSGLKEEGIAEMEEALASGEDEQGLYNLAISYAEYGKVDRGIELLKRVVSSDPGFLDAYPLLVQYLLLKAGWSEAGKKEELLSEAAHYLEKGGEAGVDMSSLVIGRALIKLTGGSIEDAIKYLEEHKNLPRVLPFLARVLIRTGQEEKAVDYLTRVLRKQPGNSSAATTLYGYYLEKGKVAEAEGVKEEFLSKTSNRKLREEDFERIRKRIEAGTLESTPTIW